MIETKRLILTPIKPKDARFLFELMNTDKWLKFIGDRHIYSEADALHYMQERMHFDLNKKGFVNHVITEKESGLKIGTCSIHDRKGVEGLDIGYALLSQFEGKGFASEAVIAMIQLVANKYKEKEVSAICNRTNTRSQKLLEKIGFIRIGMATDLDADNIILYKKRIATS